MTLSSLVLAMLLTVAPAGSDSLRGAWQAERADGTVGTLIVADHSFSVAWYRSDPAKFVSTRGGTWSRSDGSIRLSYEFDTENGERVGSTEALPLRNAAPALDGLSWRRIDDGSPGALEGAWLMTGRKRDGEISMRQPGARRTMKILSGTRFQWIAYNVATKEFFGSGGGTYTTKDGVYTENIEFFSRDDARSGRSLEFRFNTVDGAWHHEGKSTAGEPMHEIWERRIGIKLAE